MLVEEAADDGVLACCGVCDGGRSSRIYEDAARRAARACAAGSEVAYSGGHFVLFSGGQ